ncbi:MAG: hypothetical protein ABGY25_02140 [Acidimicrobiales bacterium]
MGAWTTMGGDAHHLPAPRNGLVSGCYPLDAHYKEMPARVKRAAEQADGGRRGPDRVERSG